MDNRTQIMCIMCGYRFHIDSTCDSSGSVASCDSERRCFSPVTDVCDSYDECKDGSDEEKCKRSIIS